MKNGMFGLMILLLFFIIIIPVTAQPTIVSTVPTNGATGVDPTQDISVTCSEPCSFSEFDSDMHVNIKDSDGGVVSICSYANLGNTINFGCPGGWLGYDKTYTVSIEGIKNNAGVPMAAPYSWTFDTNRACSVLTATDDCTTGNVNLGWTAIGGAAGYKLCAETCSDLGNSLSAIVSYQGGTYNLRIVPYDGQGIDICESNIVTVTFPIQCGLPSPEFPSIVLPATMIIGFLGAVLLIQRTKEQ